jgi:uncharacterized protein YjiS (DUF1127 family)
LQSYLYYVITKYDITISIAHKQKGDSAMKWLNNMWEGYKLSQQRRVAYWQLQNLSDKDLKDMGIHRSEIYRVAYGK